MLFGDRSMLSVLTDPYTLMDSAQVRIRVMERIGILVAKGAAFAKLTGIDVS